MDFHYLLSTLKECVQNDLELLNWSLKRHPQGDIVQSRNPIKREDPLFRCWDSELMGSDTVHHCTN